MTDYRNVYLPESGTAPLLPEPLAIPLQATSQQVAHDSLRSLDGLLGSGCRVLLEAGLRGGDAFLIPNGLVPADEVTRVYPDETTPRVVGRIYQAPITPGSFVGLDVVAVPSGPSQSGIVASGYESAGSGGSITIVVTYTNGDAETVDVTATIDLAASPDPQAAEPAAVWQSLLVKSATATPTGPMQPASSWWERWGRGGDVLVDVVLSYTGSPRPVDVAVVERSHMVMVEMTATRWPTAVYPFGQLPSDYPVEQATSTDPSAGTEAIRRALTSHGRELGPCLFGWTSQTEHVGDILDWVAYDNGTGDDEAPGFTVNGTTEGLAGFASITPDADAPGWIAGHYARQVDHGDDFLDGRTGVLPVWVAAYCKVAAGTGTYRLATVDGWSEITWTTASTSWTWVLTPGWLEVGTGVEDAPAARLWLKNSSTNDTSVRACAAFGRVRG